MAEHRLPSGTVTFLFTDVEGSTRGWQRHGPAMGAAVARHDALLRAAIERHGGHVFKTVGDAFCAAFARADIALVAALAGQRTLHAEEWGDAVGPVRVRMAVHVGAAEERDADYFGPAVNRVARLLSAGHGGQILLSLAAEQLVRDALPAGVGLRDLGEHRLKDLDRPERVFQAVASDLPADFPPLATLDQQPNNLPLQLTPFVGREREVADIRDRLLWSEARLLTLTGPGGTGKTRLLLQVAADLVETFPDGAWFVALEEATDVADVVAAVAQALGVRDGGGQLPLDAVQEFLRPKRLLLVLDNFEQVVAAAPVVSRLLLAAPALKILVSSRVPLKLNGEYAYAVPPLGVPAAAVTDPTDVSGYEAVRLFVERARAVRADFGLVAANAAAVAAICRELDGLPLAIELAAARGRLLPPQALLKRLVDKLGLLTGGTQDRPQRQRTLRATIAWSHELLLLAHQTLFARLSVFADGWSLDAAETVCAGGGEGIVSLHPSAPPPLPLDVLDGLESLVDHSLVRQHETAGGEPRFAMLATIREFAREQLAAAGGGGAEVTRGRHAAFFLDFAERAEPELVGRDQTDWLDRLDADHENLRAALRWSIEQGDSETALRLGAALWNYWAPRGHQTEGYDWLQRALAIGSSASATRAKALARLGGLAMDLGDLAAARTHLEASLALRRELGDEAGLAESLNGLAAVAREQGAFAEAHQLLVEALAIGRRLGDQQRMARCLYNLGWLASHGGDYAEARAKFEEVLTIWRRLGDTGSVAYVTSLLGEVARLEHDTASAVRWFEQSLELHRDTGDKLGIADALIELGDAACLTGDGPQAARRYQEALRPIQESNWSLGTVRWLEGVARLALVRGDVERAARLCGATVSLRDALGFGSLPPAERAIRTRLLADCRQAAGARWNAAWEAGKAMTLDEATSQALEVVTPSLMAEAADSPTEGQTPEATAMAPTSSALVASPDSQPEPRHP